MECGNSGRLLIAPIVHTQHYETKGENCQLFFERNFSL